MKIEGGRVNFELTRVKSSMMGAGAAYAATAAVGSSVFVVAVTSMPGDSTHGPLGLALGLMLMAAALCWLVMGQLSEMTRQRLPEKPDEQSPDAELTRLYGLWRRLLIGAAWLGLVELLLIFWDFSL